MLISLNWIEDFVDLKGVDKNELINKFTLSVAEVEEVIEKGKNVQKVITAQIKSVQPHPTSKKLHLLKVDVGAGKLLDVVCGAPNVKEGLIVPFATVGATVGNLKIAEAVVGGFTSFGMCCSEKELGISDDNSGLMEFPANTKIGVDIKTILNIDDVIFEIDNKSLTNRPDLWGHYGIAREIACLVGRPLKPINIDAFQKESSLPQLNISVNSDKCYRYTSIAIENITKKTSPKNMQIRLYYTGMRGINLLADLTNYIMLELGQPMHAFDHAIVKRIEVKDLDKALEFKTLDKELRLLPKGTMVIAANDQPVAVAGVMGGLDSEITNETTSVLVESANFSGFDVRKTATSLGLRTEASARYEKMLDPELTLVALGRYVYLLKQIDGGVKVVSSVTDVYHKHYPKITIDITKNFIDKYIGISIPETKMLSILKALEFDVKMKAEGEYEISVPSFRATKDISGRADIVEEITRIYGYDNLPAISTVQAIMPVKLNRVIDVEYKIKLALATRFNLSEINSYIWNDAAVCKELGITPVSHLKLINALQAENSNLRSSMIPSLLKSVLVNKNNYSKFGIFEIGSIISGINKQNLAIEEKHLGILYYNKEKNTEQALLKMKDIVCYLLSDVLNLNVKIEVGANPENYISPKNFYKVFSGNTEVGNISCLHPAVKNKISPNCEVVMCELNFSTLVELEPVAVKFEKVSKFPETELDFNFVIPKTAVYESIEKVANSIESDLYYRTSLIDIYENENNKSYTLRYVIGSHKQTLTANDIELFHKQVIQTFANNNIYLKQN